LGITAAAARMLLSRARVGLQCHLEPYCRAAKDDV
jgi:hypothetical protein